MASIAAVHSGLAMTERVMVMEVRRLEESDMTAWSALLALAFDRTATDMTALLRWMMTGWGLVAYGVWDGDTLAAQYSCLNMRLRHPDYTETLPIGMSVNMATHPDYRGLGLIKHAAAPVYQALKEHGAIAGVGFSNAAGVKVDRNSKGYGYQVVGQLQPWIAAPSWFQKPSPDFYLTSQLPTLEEFNTAGSGLHFEVTPEDILMRFGAHPFRRYHYGVWRQAGEILGVVVYQKTRMAGLPAVSLLAVYSPDMTGLLSRWIGALNAGTLIHVLSTPTSHVREVLTRLKFSVQTPWQKSPYYLTVKPLSDDAPTDLLNFSRWDCLGGHIL